MKYLKMAAFLILLVVFTSIGCERTGVMASMDRWLEVYKIQGKTYNPYELFYNSKRESVNEEKEPEPTPEPEPETYYATITAVGDLMVHTWQMNDAYVAETGEYDFSNDFEMVTKYLEKADFRVGNLETVFGGKEIGYSDFPMFNTPDSFGSAIKDAGFDLLTTANNHSLDKKEAGLLRTLDVLDELEIDHVGTYRSWEERDNYIIKDINGIKTAFLSYTYGTNGIPVPSGKDYLINLMSRELIKADMDAVKKLNPDIIIVMPHMGNEYETKPKQVFIDWIDYMFECGADVVLASHPHVLQPMEVKEFTDSEGNTRNVFVAYSLGNYISSQRTLPRDAGIMVNVTLSKTGEEKAVIEKVEFMPTWVQFTNQSGRDYVRVLNVADVLWQYENGMENQLRPKDINRLKNVHSETTAIYFGQPVPYEEMKEIYTFYER